jgi:long-chain fatty acid transport protein
MSQRLFAGCLRATTALGLLMLADVSAQAGGFAVREQSVYGQGASFAGIAAGGALSSIFFNPASMTQFAGVRSEIDSAIILPHSENSATGGTLFAMPGIAQGTDNIAEAAIVPSSYMSFQLNQNLWLGMSINSPFGLSVTFPNLWAGRDYASGDSHLKTYNATPMIAYRINDWISIGAGVQLQYGEAQLNKGLSGVSLAEVVGISGRGWGWGFVAGATLTPTPTTTIGIGYRSAVNQDLSGEMTSTFALPASTFGSVNTTIKLPDMVSLGIRQKLTPQFTLLGTVEWTNWSRIGTSIINQPNGAPAVILAGLGGGTVQLPFQYEDGWFFAVGGEYQWTDRLTVRAGVAYEKSPITDDVRIPLLPDNDRYWASIGATWIVGGGLAFDLAYSHVFVKDAPINISLASGNPWFDGVSYDGNVKSHIDIVSLALKYRWDHPKPALPTK